MDIKHIKRESTTFGEILACRTREEDGCSPELTTGVNRREIQAGDRAFETCRRYYTAIWVGHNARIEPFTGPWRVHCLRRENITHSTGFVVLGE